MILKTSRDIEANTELYLNFKAKFENTSDSSRSHLLIFQQQKKFKEHVFKTKIVFLIKILLNYQQAMKVRMKMKAPRLMAKTAWQIIMMPMLMNQ